MRLKSMMTAALGLGLLTLAAGPSTPSTAKADWVYSGYVSYPYSNYPKTSYISNAGLTSYVTAYYALTQNTPVGGAGRNSWIYSECQHYYGGSIYQKSNQSYVQSYTISASCNDNWQDWERFGRGAMTP